MLTILILLSFQTILDVAEQVFGGESEIRTRDKVTPVPPFQGGEIGRAHV